MEIAALALVSLRMHNVYYPFSPQVVIFSTMNNNLTSSFYVVCYESGAENPSLPSWANHESNPASLAAEYPVETITRHDVADVPGGFQLLNVLSPTECQRLILLSESLGYLKDAAVSLPREIRHNDNVVWITDEQTDGIIWQRLAHLFNQDLEIFGGKRPLGLNARFRFYRYGQDDFFKFHSDGAWPGSRVVNGELVTNAYPDRYSMMTFLIYLNEDYEGGATRFLVNADQPGQPATRHSRIKEVDIRTAAGGVLCFPHGMHPLHCIHSGEKVLKGSKYIIRSDVLFEL